LTDNKNSLKPAFQCTCNNVQSKLESHLSAAVITCYQDVFKTKTKYSGLAVISFENKTIIQELIS
ncbi:7413_t:CDS:1, partial [Cetraspora pellucida]